MKTRLNLTLIAVTLTGLIGCSSLTTSDTTPPQQPDDQPLPAVTIVPQYEDPLSLISQESMFGYMEDLTSIQPYSGWRNSATEGEVEALDYATEQLEGMGFLQELGLELERQSFRVFMSTELWETRLHLTLNGQEVEVPADGLRGPRDDVEQTLQFDSDGALNDSNSDPVVIEGPVVVVRSHADIQSLSSANVRDSVVFVDYAAIDRAILGRGVAMDVAADLLAKGPAGLVLVTEFSNEPGESHGTFVGDVNALAYVDTHPIPPTLYVRLEDLAPVGINDWGDLEQIEEARLTWDADVFSPGSSGNLVARIPGTDPSRAVILGAHIDSPNGPGAMDDGSGSVILLEAARVLNEAQTQPPIDIYLVWFGSEEIGLYGSYHFVSTHQDLLDRTVAMLQTDMLSHPPEGVDAYLNLVSWSYGRLGEDSLPWPDYVVQVADWQGTWAHASNYYGIESDNTAFSGFDVPNANLIYMNYPEMEPLGGIHHACNIHSPYDTVDLARQEGDALEDMARVVLAAALGAGQEDTSLRVTEPPDRRALFVASHTESIHMAPTTFTDLGMALAWEGFDVDMIPYGQPVTPSDLEGADLVVVLPVLDYVGQDLDTGLYDEAWSAEEIAALEAYVSEGGLLVLTNSGHRLKYFNRVLDENEDWADANQLGELFGVSYLEDTLQADTAFVDSVNELFEGLDSIDMAEYNGVPFTLAAGEVLARADGQPAIGLVGYGDAGGQVLVLADVGMLSTDSDPANLEFWLNLARLARGQ
jgi:hypothetical protein